MQFNIECPINPLSLGQVSFGVLREIWQRGLNPCILPAGPVDVSAFDFEEEFAEWLNENINRFKKDFSRKDPTIKIWHINGGEKRISDRSILWTVHETDRLTDTEVNILRNQDKVFVTSRYSKDVFSGQGVEAEVCHNYFDSHHFFKIENPTGKKEDVVEFFLGGKFEKRKKTAEIMLTWAKCFANNGKYRLNCAINNPFLDKDKVYDSVQRIFRGNVPWNINFIGHIEKNSDYNKLLNFIDIDLTGLSGAEGCNLVTMNCLALGKKSVVLDEHAHRDFDRYGNSILVEASDKYPIYDNSFFFEGAEFNQGNMFTWDEENVVKRIKDSVDHKKVMENSEIPERFSVTKTVDTLLSAL